MGVMNIVWIVILIAGVLIEAATLSLVCIWFAVGALAACLAGTLFHAGTAVQIIVFLAVSIAALALTRPLLKKFMPSKYIPTNGELDIGKFAVVIERIDAVAGTGRIRLEGVDWGAKSDDGSVIEEGATVEITAKGSAYVTVHKK